MISANDIKREALAMGFDACGMARVQPAEEEMEYLDRWLDEGCAADMDYLSRHRELRLDPSGLVEQAQTVISVALNYYPAKHRAPSDPYIALYAYGEDYHKVMRRKLKQLWQFISKQLPLEAKARCFVDSAPVLERYWAVKAGLGWIGKNSCLIIPGKGSFFFLGEIVTTWQADRYDLPMRDHCGSCMRCVEHCPSGALVRPHHLDARRCFSYLTIENRNAIPEEQAAKLGNRLYGCDSCQLACPWNRFSCAAKEEAFRPTKEFLNLKIDDFRRMNEEEYNRIFAKSAMTRAGLDGLKRTLHQIK